MECVFLRKPGPARHNVPAATYVSPATSFNHYSSVIIVGPHLFSDNANFSMALLRRLSLCLRPNASPPLARSSDGMILLSQNLIASKNGRDSHTDLSRDTIIDEEEVEEKVRRRYVKSHHNVEWKQAVEIPHLMPTQGKANLGDLRSILYTRERLEEMGC
jgi:hypothetical protein